MTREEPVPLHAPTRNAGRAISAVVMAAAMTIAITPPVLGRQPEGWRVRTYHQPLLAKHGIYEFRVEVRDALGKPVNDAAVQLRVPTVRSKEYRLVPTKWVGEGRYRAQVHLVPSDSPRYVRAVVADGSARGGSATGRQPEAAERAE